MALTLKPDTTGMKDSVITNRRESKSFLVRNLSRLVSVPVDNTGLLNIVPDNTETAQVFVGILKELKKVRFAMVRLRNSTCIPELLEAPIPIRFVFVILGPEIPDVQYHELGRSIATLMSNPEFHANAYRANGRMELLRAFESFIDLSIVIPPGEIDSKRLFTVGDIQGALRKRLVNSKKKLLYQGAISAEGRDQGKVEKGSDPSVNGTTPSSVRQTSVTKTSTSPLTRTGKLFGGAFLDIKNRIKFYRSDFTDALNIQCLSSIVFMFFAAFAPSITFGGLMGDYTDGTMGMMETLVAQCLGGLVWGLFSAQPLMIMSPTGPVLVFEASMYSFCKILHLDFLVIRVWAGLWIFLLSLVVVAFEGVFLVSYVTQFTEDIFSCLISIIFIAESLKFLIKSFNHHPIMDFASYKTHYDTCSKLDTHFQKGNGFHTSSANGHGGSDLGTHLNPDSKLLSSISSIFSFENGSSYSLVDNHFDCPKLKMGFSLMHDSGMYNVSNIADQVADCCAQEYQPNTGLLTAILLLITFFLALLLKNLNTSQYLGKTLRRALSDFGVLIAIVIVTLLDTLVFNKSYLKRLFMPVHPQFTNAIKRGHGLIIPFLLPSGQWWGYLFAALPALLVFILLFVEIEITGLLLSKKDRGLRKGTGFHWDLLLVGIMSFVSSIFGLPWMCAAAVQSLAHASSLSVMNRHAPGETPSVSHVIEQRVTTIGVALLIGACTYAGSFLKYMPLAILFGVFLYLGVMNLKGVQLLERIILCFLPRKHFPHHPYCQHVSFWRMHFYTFIQIMCLVVMYLVKYFKSSSLAFPFVLMLIALFRYFVLPKIFSEKELIALDGEEGETHLDKPIHEDVMKEIPIPA